MEEKDFNIKRQMWDAGYELKKGLEKTKTHAQGLKLKLNDIAKTGNVHRFLEEVLPVLAGTDTDAHPAIMELLTSEDEGLKKELMYSFLLGLCAEDNSIKAIEAGKELYTMKEVAKILDCHYETVRWYVSIGKLKYETVGQKKLITRESLIKMAQAR